MVLALLQKIDPSKAVGLDNLGGRFLKDGATVLSLPVTQLINLSIKSSVFPEQCKIAKLKPHYKKGSALVMLHIPMKNTNVGQQGLYYLGPKFWNILP